MFVQGQVLTLTIENPHVNARHHLTAWAGGSARSHHAPRLPDSIRDTTVGIVPELGEAVQGIDARANKPTPKPDPQLTQDPIISGLDDSDD